MKQQLLYLTLIFFVSCSIKYQRTSKDYARPVDDNVFTYKQKNFHLSSSLIDTTKIYCNAYPADKPEYFDCYRFFANGRLLSYRFFGKIDETAFADLNIGGVGYYHITDNIIRIQEFTVNMQKFKEDGGGMLVHFYGTIANDSIKIDPEKISKKYFANPRLGRRSYFLNYKKTNIKAPTLMQNW